MAKSDLYTYHQKKKFPSHKKAIAGLLIVFGSFFAFGIYAVWNLWLHWQPQIMSVILGLGIPTLTTNNMWLIGAAVFGLVILSLVMAVLASMAARRLGGTLIYIGAFFMNVLTWAVPVFLLVTGAVPLSMIGSLWPILIPGLFTLFITLLLFTVFRGRIRRAGEIIKLTGQVTLDEKGTFVPPLLAMMFTLVSALLFGGILVYFMPDVVFGSVEITLENGWPFALGIMVYLFVTIFFYNFAYSTTSAITYIYMRGRDPSLGDGVRASLAIVGGLIALSIMSVVVALIRMLIRAVARRSTTALGRGVGYAAEGAIGWIWALVNYFTIPVMVAEDVGAKDGIKRSIEMVRKNFVDVMIKETAVRWGFSVLAFMFFIGFAAGGALLGWFLKGDMISIIGLAVVFTIFASIPSALVLRTFDIVYVTLLYVFIRQKEGTISGHTQIKGAMRKELDRAYNYAKKSQ
ncbi:MAG: DUF6159 family protein [Candidatus Thorarchaeota archaeon]|nr:MAG: hypothetical protein DRP09_05240 [Candidatus Thorarchaeota archaeon]